MNTVRLEIYTWQGISVGAIHYYAELHSWNWDDKRGGKRLQRPLSEEDAARINKRLRSEYSEQYYKMNKVKPGEMDYRFDTAELAMQEAMRQWLVIFPDGDILVDFRDKNKVYAVSKL